MSRILVQLSEHSNLEMSAIRIDHINTCLDAQLDTETSFSTFEPSDLSFSNEVQEPSSRCDPQGVF